MQMTDDNTGNIELDGDAVEDVLEHLESAMQDAEIALSHDEVRPSTHRCAHAACDAYRTLVEAHPDYQLTEGSE